MHLLAQKALQETHNVHDSMVCAKSGFLNVSRVHVNLVIARAEIQFEKNLGPIKFIQQFVNNGNGELVFSRLLI